MSEQTLTRVLTVFTRFPLSLTVASKHLIQLCMTENLSLHLRPSIPLLSVHIRPLDSSYAQYPERR